MIDNIYTSINKSLGLNSKLLEFQKLAYDLQLGEDNMKPPDLKITLSVENLKKYEEIKKDFEDLLEYLLNERITIDFKKGKKIPNSSVKLFMPHDYEYLSLFSGGLDSISIPFLAKYSKKRGILHHTITHNIPHGRAIKIFGKYFEHTKKQTMITSTYKNKVKDPAYLKTRGLIFLTNALCVAAELNIPEVVIPENGPFMINVPISEVTDPTKTTDPIMMEDITKIFNHATDSNIKISTPFKNMTKSEVILSTGKSCLIQDTWSCSYFQGLSHMCGLCNSCLVRILSCYAINEGENLEEVYEINTFDVDHNTLGSMNQRKYFISKDTATFCRSILNPNTLNSIEQEKFISLQRRYPILKNYALDLMLGFKNYANDFTSTRLLYAHFKDMLNYIDQDLLDKRQMQLIQKKSKSMWK